MAISLFENLKRLYDHELYKSAIQLVSVTGYLVANSQLTLS